MLLAMTVYLVSGLIAAALQVKSVKVDNFGLVRYNSNSFSLWFILPIGLIEA